MPPGGSISVGESVLYRQMAHADGSMMLYMELPVEELEKWPLLFRSIGYWGQASSFTTCMNVSENAPAANECVLPLQDMSSAASLQPFFSCILSEFRDPHLSWQDVVPQESDVSLDAASNTLKWNIYLWPLQVTRQSRQSKLLVRSPFP